MSGTMYYDNIRLDNIRSWLVRSLTWTFPKVTSDYIIVHHNVFDLVHGHFYFTWYIFFWLFLLKMSIPELSGIRPRVIHIADTHKALRIYSLKGCWSAVKLSWCIHTTRPLWWNDHVMTVYMSSNSMKVISSQLWYLRSVPHHDPAKLHSTICILKYITFIHFCGIFCVVVVWKGSGSSPGHWLSLLSSKYSSIGNGFGDKPSSLFGFMHSWAFFNLATNFLCCYMKGQ